MSLYIGIDIASVDGNKSIDWNAAKNAGCKFAIIRGSYVNWADPTWSQEHDRAKAAGMVVGAYLFPDMGANAISPQQQVKVFASAVKCGSGDFPPTLDVEFPGGIKKTGKSRRELLLTTLLFEHLLRQEYGVPPMIYTSQRVMDQQDEDALDVPHQKVDVTAFADCPLWEARYSYNYRLPAIGDDASEKQVVERLPVPPTASPWYVAPPTSHAIKDGYVIPANVAWSKDNLWIHQYMGDAVKFPGFSATTDLNRFFDLRRGMYSARVPWLQRRLGLSEYSGGMFDDETEIAVEKFQRDRGLVADGIVGPATFSHLAWANPPKVDA